MKSTRRKHSATPLSPDGLQRLLSWFDSDIQFAAVKHERTRQRLIDFFVMKGCVDAEGLADETFDRAMINLLNERVRDLAPPEAYLRGIAKRVFIESCRYSRRAVSLDHLGREIASAAEDNPAESADFDALDACLGRLPQREKELIIEYYNFEPERKIVHHRDLAGRFKVSLGTLRVAVFRIRRKLQTEMLATPEGRARSQLGCA
jgi:RNA polymerase sigma factor (sigma-70 family)